MAAADQASAAVSRELWISFSALLRSYAAGLWQSVPGATFAEEATDTELALTLDRNRVEFRLDRSDGSGWWRRNGDEGGVFSFTEDGLVSLEGETPVEMDTAAELLTEKLL